MIQLTNDYDFLLTVTQLLSLLSLVLPLLLFSPRLPQVSLLSLKGELILLSILTTVFNLHNVTCYFFKVNAHDMLLTVCWEGSE
ncbi:hypothetical protein BHE74_00006576 [Ensete ventricosum]|nr:hypothetical protein BHE74_00006576 [Ensete ventricosum]